MITERILAVVNVGAEWVLWLLIALSVISIGITLERAFFFLARRLPAADEIMRLLKDGRLDDVRGLIAGRSGMEADVVRVAVGQASKGPESVAKVVDAQIKRSRIDYEIRLVYLATLGNNAPFVGLFGTVLGIIRAFGDLAKNPSAAGASSVMTGISEALVATAVGLLVALPAVVAFNVFQRALRRTAQRASLLGDMFAAHLHAPDSWEQAG